MADVAVDGGEAGHESSGEIGGGALEVGKVQEGLGEDGQGDEVGDHGGAVDDEAAEPLAEVVAVGAEDEEFVTEVGHADANGSGADGGEIDCEREVVVRQEVAIESDEGGIGAVTEDGVPDADAEVAEELAGGKEMADLLEQRGGDGCGDIRDR